STPPPQGWIAARCRASCGTCDVSQLCSNILAEDWLTSGFSCNFLSMSVGCEAVWEDHCEIENPFGEGLSVGDICPGSCADDHEDGGNDDDYTPACVVECAMELFPGECEGDCTCGGTRECTCADFRDGLGDCFKEKCPEGEDEWWFVSVFDPYETCLCELGYGASCFDGGDSADCTAADGCDSCRFDGDGNEIAEGACEFNGDECFLKTGENHCQADR
ncbi:hypothetical protein TeGR_g3318, partial [Tetraparma gracilis]